MSTTVLHDVPGPRAVLRNRLLAVITILVVGAALAFVIYRFAVTGQLSSEKWRVFTFPQVWQQVGQATLRTLAAFGAGGVLSLVFGVLLAIGRMSDRAWIRIPFTLVVELFRAIPVLILMMIMYYGLPTIGMTWVTPYIAVVASVAVFSGAVIAEIIRTGVESLPKGQAEAGYAIGLRKSGVMRLILLPQAARVMLPVIIAQLVVVLKDTALGFVITYQELLYLGKLLGSSASYGSPIIPAAMVAGAVYIGLCLVLAGIAKWVEVKLSKSPRVSVEKDKDPALELTLAAPR
ncbi:amino acid ABC transporter permease [Arthrobacter sp. yr096]|uniref:amino acid ABC transporter permease n=1 Tax=Arthrobacter sp. yr096 TaxID=1761750 RepID=UPI00210E5A83|nr:amino acid ABC transporter permease [Arthrobacter sp. yr096]